jgi:DNA-binding response OmpR family regulator
VLDVALPGEDGFAVADWLRRTGRADGVPLLVYTAVDLGPTSASGCSSATRSSLSKAATPPEALERRVTEVLER